MCQALSTLRECQPPSLVFCLMSYVLYKTEPCVHTSAGGRTPAAAQGSLGGAGRTPPTQVAWPQANPAEPAPVQARSSLAETPTVQLKAPMRPGPQVLLKPPSLQQPLPPQPLQPPWPRPLCRP